MKKMLYRLYFLALFFYSTLGFSQENLLYRSIKDAKTLEIDFQVVSSVFSQTLVDKTILHHFEDSKEIDFLQYENTGLKDLKKFISLELPLRTGKIQLELLEVPDSFYNYEVVNSDGKKLPANRDIKHYRGIVKDDPNSLVAISFMEDEVMGLIATEEGNFNLALDKKSGNHIFYNDKNLKKKAEFQCETHGHGATNYDTEVLSKSSKTALRSEDECVRLYFETEQDIFLARGNVASVESFVTAVFNQVATLYQNENIETTLSEIFVWTTPDPYTANQPEDLLNEFQGHRTIFNGDLAQLLTFRGGNLAGWAAGFNGLCNTDVSDRLSVSMIPNNFEIFPVFSESVFVVAHEFGHLFGSRHTHACVWNGNNTAIDGCSGCMENPDPNLGGCQNCPNPGIPSGGGTIMSYCVFQNVGVNFNLGFGLQPGNVIRNSVANADCLCECVSATISGSDYLCSSSTYSIQNPSTGSTISWSVSPTHLFSGATSGSGTTANLSPASSSASGQAILTFEVTTTCGVISVDKRIWVGNATVNDITFSNSVDEFQHWCSSDDGNTFSINSLLDPDNTQWEARLLNWPSLTVAYTSPSVYTGAGPHQWFYVPPFPTQNNGYYVFQVRNINGCSPSHWIPGFEVEYVDCTIFGGDPFRIYPNPTTDYVTVSKVSNQKLGEEIQRDQTSFEVSLFDVVGQEIISRAAATDEATLDLSKLKKGRYYIHIYYKEAIIRKQIKVE